MSFPRVSKIPHQTCPHCQAAAISARIDQQHSCGEWNEYVSYRCGLELHWSPNFHATIVEKMCGTQCKEVEITFPLHLTLKIPKEINQKDVVIDINNWGWNFNFSLMGKDKKSLGTDRGKHKIELLRVRKDK